MTEEPASLTTPTVAPKVRLRRQPRAVRWHERNKQWTISIGKVVSKDGARLRPKDFYFTATEADANAEANELQSKWAFIVRNWEKLYRPTLRSIGSDFADIPHWNAAGCRTVTVQPAPLTEEEIRAHQDRPLTADEIADHYADATITTVFGLYKLHQKAEVMHRQKRNVTYGAIEKDCKNALSFLPPNLRMDALTLSVLTEAKTKMFEKLERRTVKNYLTALKRMLRWFYDESDYGGAHAKPTNFENVFSVTNATRTDVKIPSLSEVADLLAVASDRTRLYILLALNCGMYQSDVGHLTLDEINLSEGYIYWDREKEPTNPFRVRHDLWPETLVAVRRHIQSADAPKRTFIDYRYGKAMEVDCSRLAFVDPNGNPIYQVRQNGQQYDKVTEAWREIKRKFPNTPMYKNLRKATNNVLCEMLNDVDDSDNLDALFAVGEISNMFLAQADNKLKRLYKSSGLKMYGRMNKYLRKVGDHFRAEGVFRCLADD